MATDIKVPTLGESVSEATVARWLKKVGDAIAVDEPLVELETDKVTLEVNAPAAGTLADILQPEGANVSVGAVLGLIGDGAFKAVAGGAPSTRSGAVPQAAPAPAAAPAAAPAPAGA
ncbi:biotin/lipoyl-containing protein, partial [Azospirillum isscasi]